ncbi:hypothetical protein F5X99DRAFT_403753 [Biscogniauxia marginata]|nr:hypothetical protein F5X99DRAFT_403753 [Biscogniauxia marginata]
MSLSGNFAQDFVIALGVAAAVTVVFLTLVCVLAQCGPRMLGRIDKKERWFEPALEEGHIGSQKSDLPFVQGSGNSHPNSSELTHPSKEIARGGTKSLSANTNFSPIAHGPVPVPVNGWRDAL